MASLANGDQSGQFSWCLPQNDSCDTQVAHQAINNNNNNKNKNKKKKKKPKKKRKKKKKREMKIHVM
jgi:hypothetical protein